MQNTIGLASATDHGQVSSTEGGMPRTIDRGSVADKENRSETHGRHALKMSVKWLNTFELFTTVNRH